MCTVSWIFDREGLDILCNRDELRSRKPALPPQAFERNGVGYIAPVDGDAGGSWIAVNELGLGITLLNHYEKTIDLPVREFRSRGKLVTDLMDCENQGAVNRRLESIDLAQYKPFKLLAFQAGLPVLKFVWDGTRLDSVILPAELQPITTSSFETEDVVAERLALFDAFRSRNGKPRLDWLRDFHASSSEKGGAYAVSMDRPDACTVSFSHIRIDGSGCRFVYRDAAPCREDARKTVVGLEPVVPDLPSVISRQ